jgi:hypothetical protein
MGISDTASLAELLVRYDAEHEGAKASAPSLIVVFCGMSDNNKVIAERDAKTGRFLAGNSGNGGRKPGQRNKLGEAFIADLRDVWEEMGVDALKRCAQEEPSQFIRVVASLLPRDLNINTTVGVDPQNLLTTFRSALAALGNPVPTKMPKVIDARKS